jgi:hypothetical protein
LGRLRILKLAKIPGTRRSIMVIMIIEGTLEVGGTIQYESYYLRVLAMARPGYLRPDADKVSSRDLLEVATEGETIEAIVDISLYDSDFANLLYHDLTFM